MKDNKYSIIKFASWITVAVAGVVSAWAADEYNKKFNEEKINEYLESRKKTEEEA